jgi:integrase
VYLPRPLAPDIDEELRQRLATADDQYQQGLLVMRNTGLRIGELSALELNCIRSDDAGNVFLKVPLGKMNNERLVPIDESTLAVVERPRKHHSLGSQEGWRRPTGRAPGTLGRNDHIVDIISIIGHGSVTPKFKCPLWPK